MILVKMRCNVANLAVGIIGPPTGRDSDTLVVFAAPDDVKPTFEQINATSGAVAFLHRGGWRETADGEHRAQHVYDKLPLFVPGWETRGAPPDATPMCQACYLHGEHYRCTRETTLGTKPCGCPCRTGARL